MTLGIDFDGVIADTNTVKIKWLEQNYGIYLAKEYANNSVLREYLIQNYSHDYSNLIMKHVREDVYSRTMLKRIPPVNGAVETINQILHTNNIVVITNRLEEYADDLKKWMKAHGIPVKNIYSSTFSNKLELCKRLHVDLMIDDQTKNAFQDDKIKFVLFGEQKDYQREYISNWNELWKYMG